MNESERRAVTTALIGKHYGNLYYTNAHFKLSVDSFVQMLPAFMRGLAEHAEQWSDDIQKATEAVMIMGPRESTLSSREPE